MTEKELERLERSTFLAAADSGLWDVFLAGIVSMLAIGPLLSGRLGDFWSAAVFVPVLLAILVGIRVVQNRVIRPRLGVVQFGSARQKRLKVFGFIMLAVNVAAALLGLLAATRGSAVRTELVPVYLSLVLLLGFSLVAFFLQVPRVFLYGVLLAAAPPIGETLFQRGYATHHGFPLLFGVCAVVILGSGIIRFVRFLPPAPDSLRQPLSEGGDRE